MERADRNRMGPDSDRKNYLQMEKSSGNVLLEQPGYKKGEASVCGGGCWHIIAGLLRFTLGLWTVRCNLMHGIDDAENKKKREKS